jgi:hypothetical protein
VLVDLPITRPRCERLPLAQPAVASMVAATPKAAALRRVRGLRMGKSWTFPGPAVRSDSP